MTILIYLFIRALWYAFVIVFVACGVAVVAIVGVVALMVAVLVSAVSGSPHSRGARVPPSPNQAKFSDRR